MCNIIKTRSRVQLSMKYIVHRYYTILISYLPAAAGRIADIPQLRKYANVAPHAADTQGQRSATPRTLHT